MQIFDFDFNGPRTLFLPDGELATGCAEDIIEGKSYPFPPDQEDAKVVVDIGAHAGEFTIMAALVWPAATVHAYEPYQPVREYLRHNMRGYPNVVIHSEAVGAKPGKMPLFLSSMGTLCHSLLDSGADSIEVDVVGAETIAALKPDVLKIDAEGVEWDILSNLPVAEIRRIYLEFHCEQHRLDICRLLDKTHRLEHARIQLADLGELMYVRREDAATAQA